MSILTQPPTQSKKPVGKRKGFVDSFSSGAQAGLGFFEGGYQGVRQITNELIGDEVTAKAASSRAEEIKNKTNATMQGVVSSVDDIRTDNLSDAVDDVSSFAGNLAGQGVGALAGIGTVLGGKKLAGTLLRRGGKLLPSILNNSRKAKRAGDVLAKTGKTIGSKGDAPTAALTAGLAAGGDTAHGVREEGGTTTDAAKAGLTTAALSTAANYLPTKFALDKAKKAATGQIGKATVKKAAATLATGATLGGLSEVGDELAQETGRYVGTGNFDMSTKRLKDAFIAGALTDAAFDVGTTLAGNLLDKTNDQQQGALVTAIRNMDTSKAEALSVMQEAKPEELATVLSELRVNMLNPDADVNTGVQLYAAEKALEANGDLDSRIEDAVGNLDSLITMKSEQQSSDLVFDVSNPYESFKTIATNTTPNVSAYLYSHIADGVDSGAHAATRLGMKVVGNDSVSVPESNVEAGGDTYAVGITPTQITDAPDSVVDYFSAALEREASNEGASVNKAVSTIGVYGDAEASTNTELTGTEEAVSNTAAKVAKKYNQDDVIITRPATSLLDTEGNYVARPSLTVSFNEPLSKPDAIAYIKALSGKGVAGATLTKGDNGTYVGLVATSFPELAARHDPAAKDAILEGRAADILSSDNAAYSAVADDINADTSSGATAEVVPVSGRAIGREDYSTVAAEDKPVVDLIGEHVANQRPQGIGATEAKAAAEANVFSTANAPLDHTNFGHVAGKLGSFTGRNTEEDLKLYPIPEDLTTDVPVGSPTAAKWAAVSDRLRAMMDKYGFDHETFSFSEEDFKAPRLAADGYDKGKVWIYNPYESSGAFNDPEYTKTWRIVHEMAHGITEKFMQSKYGASRRQGALGKETVYPVGRPSAGVTKTYRPLTTAEAMRAVEWEDVSFRVQRMLFEDAGVFVSNAEFNKEYIVNISDATHRVLTGEFGDAGKVGFLPSDVDSYNAYLVAMKDIQAAASIRGTEEHAVYPRMSDARLRDAVFERTAEVNGLTESTTKALVEHINKTVGSNFVVTLDKELNSLGEYDTAGRLIRLSTKQPIAAMYETLDHEMFHALSANVLTKAELTVLRRAYKKNSPRTKRLSDRLSDLGATVAAEEVLTSPDEAAAYAYQLYVNGFLHVDSVVGRLLAKIKDVLDKALNYFNGLGFVSADGIMKAAESGVFADAKLHDKPNELYSSVLDAESTVMHSRGHTRMYKEFMEALGNGELDHIPDDEIRAYADMLDKIGEESLTPVEKWRTVASGGWREWTKKNKVNSVASTVDRLYPILELDRYRTGKSSRTHAQSYMSATEAVHSSKVAYYILEHGQVTLDETGDIVPVEGTKGLYDILAPVHDIQDIVLSYMIAKRALRVGREEGGFSDKGKGLFTEAELAATINVAEKHPRFSEIDTAAEEYYALNTSLLTVAKDTGAITEAMFDALIAHGDYVPMYREMDGFTGAPKQAKGANMSGGINSLRNSNMQIADVLSNMHRNITGITQLISSTRAMKSIDEALVKIDETTGVPLHKVDGTVMPVEFDKAREMEREGKKIKPVYEDGIWEEVPPLKQVAASSGSVVSALRKQGVDIGKLSPEQRDSIIEFSALVAPTGEDIVTFMRNGKRVHRRVNDVDILRGIKGITSGRSNVPVVFKKARSLLVRSIVSFPAFWVGNTIRDVMSAYMITDINLKAGDFIEGFVSAVKKDGTYKEALVSGALPTAGHSRSGDINEDSAVAAESSAISRFTTRGFFGSALHLANRAANIAENISRLAVYKRALRTGMSRKQAGFLARDLLDFGKHGDNNTVVAMVDTIPFLNARIQGLARVYTGAKEHKGRIAKSIGAMFVLSFVLALRNNEDERYLRLTEADKDNNWHFFLPEGWSVSHLVLPKPFELGIPATMAERLAQLTFFDGDSKLVMQRAMYAVTNTLSFVPVPQLVLPVGEAAVNHSVYSGRDIVPSYLQKVEPSAQSLPNTSALAKAVAQGTQQLPDIGGTLNMVKSPILVDHLIRGYLGTFGDYIREASNIVYAAATDTPRPAATIPDYKILGLPRLIGEDWGKATSDKNMGYAMLGKVSKVENTLRLHKRNRDIKEYRAYAAANRQYLAHASEIRSVMGGVRKINKDIIELLKNKRKLPSKELRRRLDAKYKKQGDQAAKLRKYHKIFREVF